MSWQLLAFYLFLVNVPSLRRLYHFSRLTSAVSLPPAQLCQHSQQSEPLRAAMEGVRAVRLALPDR